MNPDIVSASPLCVVEPGLHALRLPLVFDSPHSWKTWPSNEPTIASEQALLSSCDAFVDELWDLACNGRAPLLAARFHRAYVDPNRSRDDIDPSMLQTPWPTDLNPSEKSELGFGLIRRLALPGVPIYAGKLETLTVQRRIESCYDPYHSTLSSLIQQVHRDFGMCLHLNCHSMKSVGNAMNSDDGLQRPDMVISDLDGMTSTPALTAWMAELLRKPGYQVNINDPYKGGELIRRHSVPTARQFSVQIEINRSLYMDEKSFLKSTDFQTLVQNLREFIGTLGPGLAEVIMERK